ncbi:hypothetical protein JHK84_040905 [Glycine max]|nr:hypothetical protein JHK85_041288 [Glycine max]KAG5122565.1 hypothetical protein JHK84_040905 [Glycine max]
MRSRGGNTTTVGASKITSTVLVYNRHHHQAFPVIVGTLLGVGAGLLWAEQGAIMTSYPPTNGKGFMCFILLGTLLSLAILPACKVLRDDGSRCTNMLYSNVSTECVERRRVWGMVGVVVVGVLGTVIWGGGLANQLSFGLLDAMFQSLVYWVIGALADDSKQVMMR